MTRTIEALELTSTITADIYLRYRLPISENSTEKNDSSSADPDGSRIIADDIDDLIG